MKQPQQTSTLIEPSFSCDGTPSHYLVAMAQEIVEKMIPDWMLNEMQSESTFANKPSPLFQFNKLLPIVRYPQIRDGARSIPVEFLFPAEYTQGAGRYLADAISKWVFPGRIIGIIGGFGLNFYFTCYPNAIFYIRQEIVSIRDQEELEMLRKNMASVIEEIRINIRAAYHIRYITSLRSSEQFNKNLIIKENISSIFNKNEEINKNFHDQMQSILNRSETEEKINEIKRNLSNLLKKRPKSFDRDIFYEIALFSAFFRNPFSSIRNSTHLSRVVAYHYLFKKVINTKAEQSPLERHISLKILRTYINQTQPVLSILIGFNLIKDTERFDIKHLSEALRNLLPLAPILSDSAIADRRDDKLRFFYIELSGNFSTKEIRLLKERLPQEVLRQIQNVVHPVFMPRNDEELMRNLIVLNKQIKYVRDLPQVSIHYDKQSESELTFTVVLVHLVKNSDRSLSRLLQGNRTCVRFDIDDIRIAGYLKNKYPKEASILRTTLDKTPFFRPDHSVDLLRARQKIAMELTKILGEFRDFNGGIILKQDESLRQLRKCIGAIDEDKELLLENYFYSLRPGIMQTVYDSSTLKLHYELLLKAIDSPLHSDTHQIFSQYDAKYFLCFIKAIAPSFKESVVTAIASLQIPSYDLTTTFLQVDQSALLGLIFRFDSLESTEDFKQKISQSMEAWATQFACLLALPKK